MTEQGQDEASVKDSAPSSWLNWRALNEGSEEKGIVEAQLFSDAWYIGEGRDHGPYSFINALPSVTHSGGQYEWKPSVVLRVRHFITYDHRPIHRTDDDHYHGGTMLDELAALLALLLGTRIVAGPIDREFGFYHRDPLGQPHTHSFGMLPALPKQMQKPQIPSLLGTRDLRDLDLFDSYPDLDRKAAIVLVKAARLYQQALWVADTAPEISWLLFVSAIEAVAGFWNSSVMEPSERLELSYPGLTKILRENPDEQLLEKVAAELQHLIAATGKFISFSIKFAPDPPGERPSFGAFDFSPKNYKKAISKIYHYRSRALHGGTPFPSPMCWPPRWADEEGGVVEERTPGLGSGTLGSTWMAEDLPMLLHLFAYITRGTILNWWKTIVSVP